MLEKSKKVKSVNRNTKGNKKSIKKKTDRNLRLVILRYKETI